MSLNSSLRTSIGSSKRRHLVSSVVVALLSILIGALNANAAFVDYYAANNFQLTNVNADGSVVSDSGGETLTLIGGNNGNGLPGYTEVTISIFQTEFLFFDYLFQLFEEPGWDSAGYVLDSAFTPLALADGQNGSARIAVTAGQLFGFRVVTEDNTGFPGEFIISDFRTGDSSVPEPSTVSLMAAALGFLILRSRRKIKCVNTIAVVSTLIAASIPAAAQQRVYSGTNITGQLQLLRTVNLMDIAQRPALAVFGARIRRAPGPDYKQAEKLPLPSLPLRAFGAVTPPQPSPATHMLTIQPQHVGTKFAGLTHYDQRNANNGNQFSIEPPNQSIAAANGFVLEGVNNAIQIYSTSGAPLLPKVLSSNEVFGLPPAIDRMSDIYGPYPTDMRVFFDHTISRWFILQRVHDNDIFDNPLDSSRLFIAVSQTADPTRSYNVYVMETTNSQHPGCPCFVDYPQIGADQYGVYISVNQYSTGFVQFVGAAIFAISKAALAAGTNLPATFRFMPQFATGFEFAIQPATTPPGSAFFQANGGLEYFVSSSITGSVDDRMAIWAMYNTSSLGTASPNLFLSQTTVPTIRYTFPGSVRQRPGPIPLGDQEGMPLAFISAGDVRILSATYAGARLYLTVASQVLDDTGRSVVGGAYVVLAPTFRNGLLAASVVRQGYVAVRNNSLLFPVIAVDAKGRGAMAMTLVGPDYFPTAAYVPVDVFPASAKLVIAAPGTSPQDGFTGYEGGPARWGDYSGATVAPDGSVWMTMQYIPNTPRTEFANWGTYITRYVP